MEISKELLSEVLGYKVTSFTHNGLTNGKIGKNFMLHINTKQSADRPSVCVIPQESINIYELAHKCKEWACKEGFILISYTKPYKDVDKKGYCQIHHTQDKNRENNKPFNCISEVEAIIKACEWILNNKPL